MTLPYVMIIDPPLEPRPGDLQAQAEELADQLGVFEPEKKAAATVRTTR